MFVLASNHFRKCFSINAGVWWSMENKFSEKYFQLTMCFNGFDPKIGFSQDFHFKPFPNSHAKRKRERERGRRAFDFAGEPRAQIMPRTQSLDHAFNFTNLRTHEPIFNPEPLTHRSTNPRTDLQPTSLRLHRRPRAFDPRAFDFVGNPKPSRHEPTNRSLSLCDFDFLCDFDRPTNRSTFLCDFDFLISLFDLWFFCCCCGGVGGGVLVVFLLCGGGFCVGGGGK